MKDFYNKYKNILLVIVITVVVFFIYSTFFSGRGSSNSFLQTEIVGGEGEALVGKELLATLLELRSLSLDESIFSTRAFIILRDFSQEVQPQATGRPNPFNDIGVDIVDSGQDDTPQEDVGATEEEGEN